MEFKVGDRVKLTANLARLYNKGSSLIGSEGTIVETVPEDVGMELTVLLDGNWRLWVGVQDVIAI